MNTCAIFAGGDFFKVDKLDFKNKYVICADSGYYNAIKNNIIPNMVIGDFDSYGGKIPESIKKIVLPTAKDDTDLIYCVKYALNNNFDNIEIYFSFGSRPDHSYCTYSALELIKNSGKNAIAYGSNFTVELLFNQEKEYNKDINFKYFSVLPYAGNAKITLKGTKYAAKNLLLTTSMPVGVSNEIIENTAKISVLGKVLVLRTN